MPKEEGKTPKQDMDLRIVATPEALARAVLRPTRKAARQSAPAEERPD